GVLPHGDAPLPARNHERVALVVLTGLIEVGIDESAGLVDDLLDPAGDRADVHVTNEDAHEERDALHRPLAEIELRRRDRVDDTADAPVRGGDDNALAHRRDPHRIAEERYAPDGEHGRDPPERRKEEEENQTNQRKKPDERVPFPMDRHELGPKQDHDRHGYCAESADSIRPAAITPST